MNGKLIAIVSLTAILLVFSTASDSEDSLASLRGNTAIDENSITPVPRRWEPDREPVARDFTQQPPVIPHATTGYVVNLKFNKCLTCHSWANYEQAHATKVSQQHFEDRDGNAQANVSASRYFCSLCHVAQRNVKPLIENKFKGIEILQPQ